MCNNKYPMIYKYVTKGGMERLFDKKTLSFTRIDRWDDVYEGIMLQVIMSKQHLSCDEKRRIAMIIPKILYAQSWTYRPEESNAMWDIFSKKSGARLCVYTSEIYKIVNKWLPDKFELIEPGHVEYNGITPVYDIDKENIRSALLHKNIAYDYEREYRFSIYNSFQWEKIKNTINEKNEDRRLDLLRKIENEVDSNKSFLDYKIEKDTIREMLLHYDSSPDELEKIKEKCEGLDLNIGTISISNLHDKGLNF